MSNLSSRNPRLEIGLFTHTRESMATAAEYVQQTSPEILAIEFVSEQDDYNVEQTLNWVSNHAEHAKTWASALFSPYNELANGIKGVRAEVVLIDRTPDNIVSPVNQVGISFESSVKEGLPEETQLDLYREFVRSMAGISVLREQRMREQLLALRTANPRKSILALIGYAHTPVYHQLRREITGVGRIFIDTQSDVKVNPPEKVRFLPHVQDVRRARLPNRAGDLQITIDDMRRAKKALNM